MAAPAGRAVALARPADRAGIRAGALVGDLAASRGRRMSMPLLQARWRAARRRRKMIVALFGLPGALLPAALAWRLGLASLVWPALVGGALVLAALAAAWSRRLDTHWVRQRLDAEPALEDSADLLFADPAHLGSLQTLQRERVLARLPERPARAARAMAMAFGRRVVRVGRPGAGGGAVVAVADYDTRCRHRAGRSCGAGARTSAPAHGAAAGHPAGLYRPGVRHAAHARRQGAAGHAAAVEPAVRSRAGAGAAATDRRPRAAAAIARRSRDAGLGPGSLAAVPHRARRPAAGTAPARSGPRPRPAGAGGRAGYGAGRVATGTAPLVAALRGQR